MGLLGKIVGGTIGFALGGPLGAVAGAVFGHAFDLNDQKYLGEGTAARPQSGEAAQFTFFVAAFSMLGKLARVDGQVSPEEIRSVENFMHHDLKLDPQSRRVAMEIFDAAGRSGDTFEAFAQQFYINFRGQPQLLDLLIDILLRVALADGVMSSAEEHLIRNAATIFQFSEAQYRQFTSRYANDSRPEADKHYAILGASPSDTADTLKSLYRKKVAEFHPDKIASKGLPEEFTQFAEEKFREIQEAWEHIKKDRGIK
ncbi:MAG: co-chaperone DjlA [Pseudomonadota bacterium]